MDAFYASVETSIRPEYRGRPLAVGGQPGGRGVLCTANYEARKFGIRSAMPSNKAVKLCPDLVIVPPNFPLYKEISAEIRRVLESYSSVVEPVSLDEAYLDVSASEKPASWVAREIRSRIHLSTNLTASAGVGPNRMLAKIASDLHKPDGLTIIRPEMVYDFMRRLPVAKIPGIGPVSQRKLAALGIERCEDVYRRRKLDLYEKFGKNFTDWLWERAQGIDKTEVGSNRERKSISSEKTFPRDIRSAEEVISTIREISEELSNTLIKKELTTSTVTLKLRTSNFTTRTKTLPSSFPIFTKRDIFELAAGALKYISHPNDRYRLVGIKVSSLAPKSLTGNFVQRPLFSSRNLTI